MTRLEIIARQSCQVLQSPSPKIPQGLGNVQRIRDRYLLIQSEIENKQLHEGKHTNNVTHTSVERGRFVIQLELPTKYPGGLIRSNSPIQLRYIIVFVCVFSWFAGAMLLTMYHDRQNLISET